MIQAAKIIATGLVTTVLIGVATHLDILTPAQFTYVTLLIAVLISIKILICLDTHYRKYFQLTPSMLFALGFVFMLTIGGLIGIILANPSLGITLHTTYYIFVHFHYVLSFCVLFILSSGCYFLVPKLLCLDYNTMLRITHLSINRLWIEHSFICKCFIALLGVLLCLAIIFFLVSLQAPLLCDSFQPIGSMSAYQTRIFYRCLSRALLMYSSYPGRGPVTFHDLIVGSGEFYSTGVHNFNNISQSRLEHPGQPEPTINSVAFFRRGDSIEPTPVLKELISLFKDN